MFAELVRDIHWTETPPIVVAVRFAIAALCGMIVGIDRSGAAARRPLR